MVTGSSSAASVRWIFSLILKFALVSEGIWELCNVNGNVHIAEWFAGSSLPWLSIQVLKSHAMCI